MVPLKEGEQLQAFNLPPREAAKKLSCTQPLSAPQEKELSISTQNSQQGFGWLLAALNSSSTTFPTLFLSFPYGPVVRPLKEMFGNHAKNPF